jgi:polyhydroxyalkanoate synthesis regulator phasin
MPIAPTFNDFREQTEQVEHRTRNAQHEPPHMRPRRLLDEEPPANSSSRLSIWLAIILLAGGLAGASWYGHSKLNQQGGLLSQMSTWKESLSALTKRVGDIESRLQALPGEVADLKTHLSGLEERIATGRAEARRGVQRLGDSIRKELRDNRDSQTRMLEARIQELNAARQSDAARTAQLENRVGQLNQQLAAAVSDIAASREIATFDSRQLRQEIRQTDGRLTQVASFNDRPRERFSAGSGATRQIAPNILLHITRVDPAYRRFDGWLQLADEGKFLWIKKQGVLQTVGFHAGTRRLRHDLIVTDISRDGVSGYLILPSVGESANVTISSSAVNHCADGTPCAVDR